MRYFKGMTTRNALLAALKANPSLTVPQLADRFLVSRQRVREILASEGIQVLRHTRKGEGVTLSRIRQLLEADPTLTAAQIAEEVGISKSRVYQIATRARLGIARAPRPVSPPQSRLQPLVAGGSINHTVAGTISELLAAADLMARGWHVFFPLVRNTKIDLIASSRDGERLIRVEVRSGKRVGERAQYLKKDGAACDHYAIVMVGEPVEYDPPLPGED